MKRPICYVKNKSSRTINLFLPLNTMQNFFEKKEKINFKDQKCSSETDVGNAMQNLFEN